MPGFAYSFSAIVIFIFVTVNFLFPCNRIFPLDRRTTSVIGAILCYFTRKVFFDDAINLLDAVNFDVMVMLSSIMIINHLVIHVKETKDVILYMQELVQRDPINGLWILSLAAFIASPFLTNDGVCLLFVEPILKAFEHIPHEYIPDATEDTTHMTLRKSDVIYFLLALACSANIGSALTYTGNPQNMIISSDALSVLPSYKFFLYMLPASMFSWIITIKWIQRCWLKDRNKGTVSFPTRDIELSSTDSELHAHASRREKRQLSIQVPDQMESNERQDDWSPLVAGHGISRNKQVALLVRWLKNATQQKSTELVLSPRRRMAILKNKTLKPPVFSVVSPFPYAVLILLGIMIILIFVNVIPIAGLIAIFAVLMIVTVVMGNHLRHQQTWVEELDTPTSSPEPSPQQHFARGDPDLELSEGLKDVFSEAVRTVEKEQAEQHRDLLADMGPPTREDEVDSLNRFFEALYASIDYNLLLIFLGLFVVIANLSNTGIPKSMWHGMVGPAPFKSFGSVFSISVFVLFASQFVGNVPIIQLAKPNVSDLDDNTKRLAWAVLSFVATVGGNLTLTGSAANVIVAEKAARLDATMSISFFRHFHVCFWVTLLSCFVGACLISIIAIIDNAIMGN